MAVSQKKVKGGLKAQFCSFIISTIIHHPPGLPLFPTHTYERPSPYSPDETHLNFFAGGSLLEYPLYFRFIPLLFCVRIIPEVSVPNCSATEKP